jgi:hypothetical protein
MFLNAPQHAHWIEASAAWCLDTSIINGIWEDKIRDARSPQAEDHNHNHKLAHGAVLVNHGSHLLKMSNSQKTGVLHEPMEQCEAGCEARRVLPPTHHAPLLLSQILPKQVSTKRKQMSILQHFT